MARRGGHGRHLNGAFFKFKCLPVQNFSFIQVLRCFSWVGVGVLKNTFLCAVRVACVIATNGTHNKWGLNYERKKSTLGFQKAHSKIAGWGHMKKGKLESGLTHGAVSSTCSLS